jgi:hypothetical protein
MAQFVMGQPPRMSVRALIIATVPGLFLKSPVQQRSIAVIQACCCR